LMVPFFKEPVIGCMGWIGTFVFLALVLVGASNAVNLTDGLDGLAIGCSNSAVAAYLAMAYMAGHFAFAEYLQVPFVRGGGELAVFCGALLGAGLGFLWFNCHPAKIFMGDTGSLALGGAVATVAILIKQELVLILVGGVFVMEAVSVILQVGWFKFTRKKYGEGRRVFLRAPLHHHFEYRAKKLGRTMDAYENRITIRFWILSIIFALIGVASLKIR
jgi:phospho-N-acetylmuramoyl-pentapeptide-transferase